MRLRVVSDDGTRLVVAHEPVAGAIGFRLSSSASPRFSHTWDGSRTRHAFRSGCTWLKVEALLAGDSGMLPSLPGQPLRAPSVPVLLDEVVDSSRRSP